MIGVPLVAALAAAAAFLTLGAGQAPAPQQQPPGPSLCPGASGVSPGHSSDRPASLPRSRSADRLIWSDEFDGTSGALPDPSRWLIETGGKGWGEGELQAYTDSPDNVSLTGDGQLEITARQERGAGGAAYTSARISTCGTFEFTGGRVEARLKLPRGQGLWPAFWTMGASGKWPQDGEIDILESINGMATIDANIHQPRADGSDWELAKSSPRAPSGTWADDYHVVAVDWTRDELTWSIDGNPFARTTRAETPADGFWVLDRKPQVIVLNLAVGGYPGRPNRSTAFPASLLVDYVRVYANDDTDVHTNLTGPTTARK
jgi:beta-glucanase (GH16 family)